MKAINKGEETSRKGIKEVNALNCSLSKKVNALKIIKKKEEEEEEEVNALKRRQ